MSLLSQPPRRRLRLLPAAVQKRLGLLDQGAHVKEEKGAQGGQSADDERATVRVAQHLEDPRLRSDVLAARGLLPRSPGDPAAPTQCKTKSS